MSNPYCSCAAPAPAKKCGRGVFPRRVVWLDPECPDDEAPDVECPDDECPDRETGEPWVILDRYY